MRAVHARVSARSSRSLQPVAASRQSSSTGSSLSSSALSATLAAAAQIVDQFPYVPEDGYGDYDVDAARDLDLITADMKKVRSGAVVKCTQ